MAFARRAASPATRVWRNRPLPRRLWRRWQADPLKRVCVLTPMSQVYDCQDETETRPAPRLAVLVPLRRAGKAATGRAVLPPRGAGRYVSPRQATMGHQPLTPRKDSPMSEQRHPTGAVNHLAGGLSRKEVAAIMGISKNRVQQIESRALAKLRRNPLLRHLAAECGIATEDVKP